MGWMYMYIISLKQFYVWLLQHSSHLSCIIYFVLLVSNVEKADLQSSVVADGFSLNISFCNTGVGLWYFNPKIIKLSSEDRLSAENSFELVLKQRCFIISTILASTSSSFLGQNSPTFLSKVWALFVRHSVYSDNRIIWYIACNVKLIRFADSIMSPKNDRDIREYYVHVWFGIFEKCRICRSNREVF